MWERAHSHACVGIYLMYLKIEGLIKKIRRPLLAYLQSGTIPCELSTIAKVHKLCCH